MTKQELINVIVELLQECEDIELLRLIYTLLIDC